jgi:hypothetical protein
MFWISQAREGSCGLHRSACGLSRPAAAVSKDLIIEIVQLGVRRHCHKRQFHIFRLSTKRSPPSSMRLNSSARKPMLTARTNPFDFGPREVDAVLEQSRLINLRNARFEGDAALGRLVELYGAYGSARVVLM